MSDVLVIGSLNMDFVMNVEKAPLPGETILTNTYNLVPGGKGGNKAYALGKLGTSVAMLGAVGCDEMGKKLIANLKKVKVDTKKIVKLKNINTGNAFITVDKTGENRIVVASGANNKLTKEMIDKNINLIKAAKIIVMQLEIPLEVVTYAAKLAKSLGKIVVLDPAPAVNNLPLDLYKNIDIIKPNETELQTLCNSKINTEEDIVTLAKSLIEKGVKNVIVTLGEKGSILVNNDTVQKYNAINVEVVDTTAAGDSFTAGLVKSLVDGKDLNESIKFGHIVSSLAVTKHGAQSSIPSIEEIKKFIERVNING